MPPGRTDLALLQTSTTLNFRGGWLARLVCSGLDYQIEHHLFPGIPHTSYRKMSPLVRRFCLEHGLPYRSLPWGKALWESWMVLRNPQGVARRLESLPLPDARVQA
jgi:fatty acid desaturase